jgi:hypothetical protein
MRIAEQLISDLIDDGIMANLASGKLKLLSARPIPPELVTRIRAHREEVIEVLTEQRSGKPSLHGEEFRVSGGLLSTTALDALLAVGASNDEIERHIHAIGTPMQWKRWQEIIRKRQRYHAATDVSI